MSSQLPAAPPPKTTSAARVRQALGALDGTPLVFLHHAGMLPDVTMPNDLESRRITNILQRCPLL